jgi:anti-anti-sigma regulatory factor
MLRIHRSENGEVVFTVSGQMDEEAIAELKTLISSESNLRPIVLDLKDLTLVNENAIAFFVHCEANSITLKN